MVPVAHRGLRDLGNQGSHVAQQQPLQRLTPAKLLLEILGTDQEYVPCALHNGATGRRHDGLRALLGLSPTSTSVGDVANGREAGCSRRGRWHPDVVAS
jgi:hypothetical protein